MYSLMYIIYMGVAITLGIYIHGDYILLSVHSNTSISRSDRTDKTLDMKFLRNMDLYTVLI